MNKIKKTSAVISHATFVLYVFCNVKFVMPDYKRFNLRNIEWSVSVEYNFTWNVSMAVLNPKGLFTWRWRTKDRWGNMRRVTPPMRDYVDRRVTHQSGLPHLPGVPHLHVNRP